MQTNPFIRKTKFNLQNMPKYFDILSSLFLKISNANRKIKYERLADFQTVGQIRREQQF